MYNMMVQRGFAGLIFFGCVGLFVAIALPPVGSKARAPGKGGYRIGHVPNQKRVSPWASIASASNLLLISCHTLESPG
jgi:hypothetical protein